MTGGIGRRLAHARVQRNGAIAAIGAVAMTMGTVAAGAVAPASAGTASSAKVRDVTITIAGLGLDGQPVSLANNQSALWPLSASNTGAIYGGADGVYQVLPGKYLVGGYVPLGNGQYQTSVVVEQVTIRKSETITLDSEGATPFSVGLTGVSATEQGQFADVCVTGGSGRQRWAMSFMSSTSGGTQYIKAFTDKDLALVYHAFYTGGAGVTYDIAGAHAGGLPASAAFTANAADLARLTIAARSGTITGSLWAAVLDWQYGNGNCGANLSPELSDRALPGQVTQYVSPGLLAVGALPASLASESSFDTDVRAAAGRSYTETFFNAVAGPTAGTPTINDGLLCSMPGMIYGDPLATGWAVDAVGTVTLRHGHKSLGERGFGGFTCFRENHKTGWYTMTESAHHASPPAGVTPASLSTTIDVTWRFRIPALSSIQYTSGVQLPATVTTFSPAGLSLANQVAPGTTSIVMHVIRNGGYSAAMALSYPLRAVRVQYSSDGGRYWQDATVTVRRGYWVVTVPSSGSAVSLRSTVTDVRGDSTVETIYNAYGVS